MKRLFFGLFTICCLAAFAPYSARATEAGFPCASVRTNWVDRWITNTTEIHMQVNRFVTEFHTNWVKRIETNYVDLFATNVVPKYQTNWIAQYRTNLVNRFDTNLITRTLTNTVVLDSVRTNYAQAYRTNLVTLNLTNWTTVIAFKTNWVNKPLTNLVEINMNGEPPPATSSAVKPPSSSELLSLQASRGSRPTTNNQVEVQLKVSWAHAPGTAVRVQQWRVERDDGSILLFGQDPEFKRALPQGTYKVTVRAQRDANGPFLAALGTLTVTQREVSVEQKPVPSNSST